MGSASERIISAEMAPAVQSAISNFHFPISNLFAFHHLEAIRTAFEIAFKNVKAKND